MAKNGANGHRKAMYFLEIFSGVTKTKTKKSGTLPFRSVCPSHSCHSSVRPSLMFVCGFFPKGDLLFFTFFLTFHSVHPFITIMSVRHQSVHLSQFFLWGRGGGGGGGGKGE